MCRACSHGQQPAGTAHAPACAPLLTLTRPRLLRSGFAVRDTRRAHLPGGSIKLEKGQLDVHAKIDALEVRWVGWLLGAEL